MYFRDLAISVSSWADIPNEHSRKEFYLPANAVQEIFLTFMPAKYVLDGTGKTNLLLGPRGVEKQYLQLLNVNKYFVEDFDFEAYFAATIKAKDELLLISLERGLLDIATKHNADPTPIRHAIFQTRQCGGERRYVIDRMSRASRSRKLRLKVWRHIFREGESWSVDICDGKGAVLQTQWIAERTNFLDAAYNYKRTSMNGDEFVILDWLGQPTYSIDLKSLENR